jgi:DDE superfamily endonuclease
MNGRPREGRWNSNPSGWKSPDSLPARLIYTTARTYPAEHCPRVGLGVDKAAWHQGALGTAALADCPHLELYPLPSYSPKLQVIERFWKVLRRRATHHRLFPTLAQLKRALRNSLGYYQTFKHRVLSIIQSPRKRTKSSAA